MKHPRILAALAAGASLAALAAASPALANGNTLQTLEGTPAYTTSATGFGQAFQGGQGSATAVGAYGIVPQVGTAGRAISARVTLPSNPSSTKVAFGASAVAWMGANSSGQVIGSCGNTGSVVSTGKTISDGNWHTLEFDETTSTCYFFVDGALGGSIAYNADKLLVQQLAIGDFGGTTNLGNFPWTGNVDEVAVFNAAQHTAAYTPATAPFTGSEANEFALYHLDGNGSDANTSAAAMVTLPTSSPAAHFSPANWQCYGARACASGVSYPQSWNPGAYFSWTFNASSASPMANLLLGTNANASNIAIFINGLLTDNVPASGPLTLTGLTPGATNTVTVWYKPTTSTARWGNASASGQSVQVQGLQLDGASTAGVAQTYSKWVLAGGDSINEGWVTDAGTNNFVHSNLFNVAQDLFARGYDIGVEAAAGDGFLATGNGNVPALYNVTSGGYQAASSRWNLTDAGVSLLSSDGHISAYGAVGQDPSEIFWNFGTNDANTSVSTTYLRPSVSGVLAAYRAAAPAAKIVFVPGFPLSVGSVGNASTYLATINGGISDYLSAAPDGNFSTIDLGKSVSIIYANPTGLYKNDNFHPLALGNAIVAPAIEGAMLAPLLSRSPGYRPGFH